MLGPSWSVKGALGLLPVQAWPAPIATQYSCTSWQVRDGAGGFLRRLVLSEHMGSQAFNVLSLKIESRYAFTCGNGKAAVAVLIT